VNIHERFISLSSRFKLVNESVADKIELVLYCIAVFVILYQDLTPFAKFVLAVEC